MPSLECVDDYGPRSVVSPDAQLGGNINASGMQVTSELTLLVDRASAGGWQVELPGRPERMRCDTLEEARAAVRRVVASQPCRLVVRDAYLRVVACELIRGDLVTARGFTPSPITARTGTVNAGAARGMTSSGTRQQVSPVPY
jgi:hypothetical protein